MSIAPIQKNLAQNNKILLNKPFEMTALQDDETIPVNLEVNGLSILPQNISLTSPLDYAQILVRADLGKGRVLDVTRMVTWSIPDELCSIDNRGLLTPAKDGKGEIKATLGKHDVSLSFSFAGINKVYEPDFISEVNPVISKLGCNAELAMERRTGRTDSNCRYADMIRCMMSEVLPMIWHQACKYCSSRA